jgi:hypothetical protein
MSRHLLLLLGPASVVALDGLLAVWGTRPGQEWPPWLLVALGSAVGAAGGAVFCAAWLLLPLLGAARTCKRVAAGDLSETLPESGPRPLRAVAKVFNTVLADFQEVLLLFAHFLRSASASIQALRELADGPASGNTVRSLCAGTLDDLRNMQEMIEGFRYFRVRIEGGAITDAGALPADRRRAQPRPSDDVAATGPFRDQRKGVQS